VPAERNLLGLVHDPHAAPGDLAKHPVIAELLERRDHGRRAGARGVALERLVGQGERIRFLECSHSRDILMRDFNPRATARKARVVVF
jgi:hypothetical protein